MQTRMTWDHPLTQRAVFRLSSPFFSLDRSCFQRLEAWMFVPSYSEVPVLWKGKPWLYVKTPVLSLPDKLEFLFFFFFV